MSREIRELYNGGSFQVREVMSNNPHLPPRSRQLIHCRPCAVVVCVRVPNEVLVVTQHRDNVGMNSLEFAGGMFEHEEDDPRTVGERELLEETGYGEGTWIDLTPHAQPRPFSLSTQHVHCFLVREPVKLREPRLDFTERGLVSHWQSFRTLQRQIAKGRMTNSTNHSAWLLAKLWLEDNA